MKLPRVRINRIQSAARRGAVSATSENHVIEELDDESDREPAKAAG